LFTTKLEDSVAFLFRENRISTGQTDRRSPYGGPHNNIYKCSWNSLLKHIPRNQNGGQHEPSPKDLCQKIPKTPKLELESCLVKRQILVKVSKFLVVAGPLPTGHVTQRMRNSHFRV